MVRKVLYPAVFVLMVLMASPAFASWPFWAAYTANPDAGYAYDGRIYMPDTTTLVPEGAFVQFILDTEGDGLDDPLAYFGGDVAAITAWVNAGADPSAIGDDVLLTASGWDGTSEIGQDWGFTPAGPGEILVYPDNPFNVTVGDTGDLFGYRVWNLSLDEMATFCTRPGEELWYMTGVEYGAWIGAGGDPLDPWWIGAPDSSAPGDWNFFGEVGSEVAAHIADPSNPLYRSQNVLDVHLATCGDPVIPEPGTMLLIGSSALLLVLRRKK